MPARRPTLPEPIEVNKFWKGRRRDKAIVVSLSTYEQTNIVNVREHLVGGDGCMRPTTKGVAMAVRASRRADFPCRHRLARFLERDPHPLDYARSPSIIAAMADKASAHPT